MLKRRIDLFTSPSNTELVQLELELMGDLGVNWTKLKITSQSLSPDDWTTSVNKLFFPQTNNFPCRSVSDIVVCVCVFFKYNLVIEACDARIHAVSGPVKSSF